ncbi:hypothetical protein KIPB_010094, partial [Kipferlia bialata]
GSVKNLRQLPKPVLDTLNLRSDTAISEVIAQLTDLCTVVSSLKGVSWELAGAMQGETQTWKFKKVQSERVRLHYDLFKRAFDQLCLVGFSAISCLYSLVSCCTYASLEDSSWTHQNNKAAGLIASTLLSVLHSAHWATGRARDVLDRKDMAILFLGKETDFQRYQQTVGMACQQVVQLAGEIGLLTQW